MISHPAEAALQADTVTLLRCAPNDHDAATDSGEQLTHEHHSRDQEAHRTSP